MIRKISLATDFTPESEQAFHTALALAVVYRAQLDILHVGDPVHSADWAHFPRVRDVLIRWGMLQPQAAQEDVHEVLGLDISKVEIHSRDPASGISSFIAKHTPDLLVAASHGRSGLSSILAGSVALETLERTSLPTLLLGPKAKSIVDASNGRLSLENALVPVSLSPSPTLALRRSRALLGDSLARTFIVHVEEDASTAEALRAQLPGVRMLRGDVIPALLGAARMTSADIIIMPTEGRRGFLDALRGSTTQRMLREAECPVLALPAF